MNIKPLLLEISVTLAFGWFPNRRWYSIFNKQFSLSSKITKTTFSSVSSKSCLPLALSNRVFPVPKGEVNASLIKKILNYKFKKYIWSNQIKMFNNFIFQKRCSTKLHSKHKIHRFNKKTLTSKEGKKPKTLLWELSIFF